MLHIDFETRSACDLRKAGSYRYAEDPTTSVWMMAYAFDDEPVQLWWPKDKHCPDRIVQHIAAGQPVAGWNAGGFERHIWQKILVPQLRWPVVPLRQWIDPMAWALAMALPAQLAQCAQALGVEKQKDMAGHRLMMQMARPRRTEDDGRHIWWDDADRQDRLAQYCMQDVEAEREIMRHLLPLSRDEQELWYLDQAINDRGVLIDQYLIDQALQVVEKRIDKLNSRIRTATNGAVQATTQVAKIGQYLREIGYPVESLDKEAIADILDSEAVPDAVRDVVQLRRAAAKSSTAKLVAMGSAVARDGRVHGLLQYHKAGTGRWSSTLVQVHNLPRGKFDMDQLCADLLTGDDDAVEFMWGDPLTAVSQALRGCIVPAQGRRFVVVDYSQIEARITAHLAGQRDAVEAFFKADRGEGPDFYVVAAERIGSNDRQLGKVVTLALGFGMGAGKFQESAATYGITLTAEDAESIVKRWRAANDKIRRFWYALDDAAKQAVRRPGDLVQCGPVAYRMANHHLWCRLPSKRALCYPFPALVRNEDREELQYMGINSYTRKWERSKLYGGLLCENIVQATARDVLAGAMKRLERAGFPIAFHVHDEVICEIETNRLNALEHISSIAKDVPEWLVGCPINVGGFVASRYRKG